MVVPFAEQPGRNGNRLEHPGRLSGHRRLDETGAVGGNHDVAGHDPLAYRALLEKADAPGVRPYPLVKESEKLAGADGRARPEDDLQTLVGGRRAARP